MSPDQCAQPTEIVTAASPPATATGAAATAARSRSAARSAPSRSVSGQDHHELVAAPAGQLVAAAQRAREPPRHLLQHPVARLVAVGVVDALEVVDVDAAEREQVPVAGGQGDRALELVGAVAAVRQPGQVVGERLRGEPLVGVDELVVERLDAQRRPQARIELDRVERRGEAVLRAALQRRGHRRGVGDHEHRRDGEPLVAQQLQRVLPAEHDRVRPVPRDIARVTRLHAVAEAAAASRRRVRAPRRAGRWAGARSSPV